MNEENETMPRSFAVFLTQCREGALHSEASAQLAKLLTEMKRVAQSAGKAKGVLTMTLAFELEDGVVEVTGDVKTKEPKLPTGRAVFWLDESNHLVTENPRQTKLPIRDVSAPTTARDAFGPKQEAAHG